MASIQSMRLGLGCGVFFLGLHLIGIPHREFGPPAVQSAEKMVVAFRTVTTLEIPEGETLTREELINRFLRRIESTCPGQSYRTEVEKFPRRDKPLHKHAPGRFGTGFENPLIRDNFSYRE